MKDDKKLELRPWVPEPEQEAPSPSQAVVLSLPALISLSELGLTASTFEDLPRAYEWTVVPGPDTVQ